MIVVATADFELYHDVVGELRDRDEVFTTIEVGENVPENAAVIITDRRSKATFSDVDRPVVSGESEPARALVDRALTLTRGGEGKTIVGVDPGRKPGIAVLVDDIVTAVYQVALSEAPSVIESEVTDVSDPIVRIGDGARLQGSSLINDLDVPVELVDETATTPYLGTGTRGMGDVVAAINIARIEGEPIDEREIEPTDGELQLIKDRSRRHGKTDRAIDDRFAHRVASGELSIDEALAEHRAQSTSNDDTDR
ncbi:hypothetical protein [Halovivax gelatinilyticus]|uniref:hypothetical protein n=1 Tax=Halovivax gelatinilyticus TaxID=2961597 RepID=UPI0020CA91BF|nr:hypothetical protein [Halovivax gelatinilyticus]